MRLQSSLFLLAMLGGAAAVNDAKEYCQWEVFNATCPDGHVILLETAHYGRMRLGRCLTTDVYIGCSADVLAQLDARCSGRQSCEITLPDSSLHQRQPCPRDMMAYLEAGYTCVRVQSSDDKCLQGSGSIKVSETTGILASHVTQTSGQGSTDCPWSIQVEAGQHVNIYLLDFTLSNRYKTESSWNTDTSGSLAQAEYCHVYAVVKESNSRDFTVCAGNVRERLVYTSHTHQVEIHIMHHSASDDSIAFMLKYGAVGCPDLVPPAGAFVVRDGDKATVSCNQTSQAWHLVCKHTTWIGDAQQCSPEAIRTPTKANEGQTLPSYGLFIAVGIGVVIGVCCGFTMLGTVLWCRRQGDRQKRRRQQEAVLQGPAPGDTMTMQKCKVHRLKDGCGFTHVWEVQSQGRNPSLTAISPDSAYQTYQRQITMNSGEPAVCFHNKNHVYESPLCDENGTKVVPFYHEFDHRNLQDQTNSCRTLPQKDTHAHVHAHAHGPCHVHVPVEAPPDLLSDDTDEEDRCRFVKTSGYTRVPDSPPEQPRSRAENHYT